MALVRFAALLAALLATSGLMSLTGHGWSGSSTFANSAPKGAPLIPLVFEENRGQAGPAARFVARVPGGTVLLSRTETVVKVHRSEAGRNAGASAAIRMRLAGSQSGEIRGERLLRGKAHYLRGSDPKQWRRNVPLYEQVRSVSVYPGVDLVYHTAAAPRLEYDFVVAPGADPGAVRMEFSGATVAHVDGTGDLVLDTPAGEVRQLRPVAYQESEGRRVPVEAHYQMRVPSISGAAAGVTCEMGFRIGDYDPNKALVIDPVLTYSTYLGGGGNDSPRKIAAASDGTVYIAGITLSSNFPSRSGFRVINRETMRS